MDYICNGNNNNNTNNSNKKTLPSADTEEKIHLTWRKLCMLHTWFSWKICYVGSDFSIKAQLAYEWLLDSIAYNVFCWYIF